MPLFRGRRLSFTSNSGNAKARSGSVHRVSPDHAMALRDPVMQTMRATLLQEEALRSGAGGKKQYEVPMPRTYDDFVRDLGSVGMLEFATDLGVVGPGGGLISPPGAPGQAAG